MMAQEPHRGPVRTKMAQASAWLGPFGALTLLALLVAAYVWRAKTQHEALERLQARLNHEMGQDTPAGYREVASLGARLIKQGDADDGVVQMVTYAATILAIEHQDGAMLPMSRELLGKQPIEGEGRHEDITLPGYLTAAHILGLYGNGDLGPGLALAEAVGHEPDGRLMAALESLRLRVAARVDGPKIGLLAQALGAEVNDEVRALVYLGLWQLSENNTAQAEQYLRRAVALSPGHPQALLGLQWVRLYAAQPAPQDVRQAQQQVGEVLRLPTGQLTPPVRATALLVRALAAEFQGDSSSAQKDRAEALQLDPANLLHEVSRDGAARL